MSALTLQTATDTYVDQATPTKVYGKVTRLGVGTIATKNRYGYIYFGQPFPKGVTMTPGKNILRIWTVGAFTGTLTLSVQRVGTKFSDTTTTYNSRPSATGTVVSVTKTNPAANTMWEFDVTALQQTVAAGGGNFGWRLSSTTTTAVWVHSAQSVATYRPELDVAWTEKPEPPTGLSPSNNRAVSVDKPLLGFDFVDLSGEDTLDAVQVQINSTSDFTTPTYDSGWVLTDVPELDLSTTGYAGMAVGASVWWRVQVRDNSGLISGWSIPAQMQRQSKGTAAWVSPSAAAAYIEDPSPTVTWSFTGKTQRAVQLILTIAGDPKVLWTSGKLTTPNSNYTIPAGAIKDTALTYRLTLLVWDTIEREPRGTDTGQVTVSQDFTYRMVATVTPVTSLVVVQDGVYPWAKLTWSRTTDPDSFSIERDDKIIDSGLLAADLRVSGQNFVYYDRLVSPRVSHTWEVLAIQNSQTSSPNLKVTQTIKPSTCWMVMPDGSKPIVLWNYNVDLAEADNASLMQAMAAPAPILISQTTAGIKGTVEGVIDADSIAGVSGRTMRDTLKYYRDNPGVAARLIWADEALPIIPYNVKYKSRVKSGNKVIYDVSFSFFGDD